MIPEVFQFQTLAWKRKMCKYKCIKTINTLNTHKTKMKGGSMIGFRLQDRRPLYEQVTEKFRTLIYQGVLPADSRIPSVRQLAMELSINPNTIRGHI